MANNFTNYTPLRARKLGRRSKFNATVAEKLILLLKAGNAIPQACVVAGISARTYYNWLQLGERPGKKHAAYRQFKDDVERARAECEAQLVAVVRTAAANDAKHAEWLLERRNPQEWGRATRVVGPVQIDAHHSGAVRTMYDDPLGEAGRTSPAVAAAVAGLLTTIAEASPIAKERAAASEAERA